MILPMCYFDKTNCFDGIEALRSYQRKWIDHTQTFANAPLHNWASNGADAFRYMALVAQKSKGQSAEVHMNRPTRLSPEDLAPKITLDGLYADREVLSMGRRARRI